MHYFQNFGGFSTPKYENDLVQLKKQRKITDFVTVIDW
jgi:hypothetical protein